MKKFWWFIFAVTLGQVLSVLTSAVMLRIHRWGAWSIGIGAVSLILFPVSILALRRAYKKEPMRMSGHWHLAMTDFYATSLFAAIMLSLWSLTDRAVLVNVGIPQSIRLSIGFLACLLVAARIGCKRLWLRVVYALGLVFTFHGMMGAGALLLMLAQMVWFSLFYARSIGDGITQTILFMVGLFWERSPYPPPENWGMIATRVGLLSLPMGLVLLRWAKRRLEEERKVADALARLTKAANPSKGA